MKTLHTLLHQRSALLNHGASTDQHQREMMESLTDLAGYRCSFDEYSFIHLCSTGQIDNLPSLLEVEERYSLSADDLCIYRTELASAEGSLVIDYSNTDWRYRICRWMIRTSDEFSISRDTALIAIAYCDRYLLKKKISRHLFQVVAITCLFVASKLYEKRPIKLAALMNYTQHKFDRDEILSMEEDIMTTLGSYLYPPTAVSFCLMLLSQLPCDSTSMSAAIETCQFLLELATCDFFFVAHKQSKLAVAALIVTMEQMRISSSWLSDFHSMSDDFTKDLEIMACVKQLQKIYTHNEMRIKAVDGGCDISTSTDGNDRKRVCTPSPTPEDSADYEESIKRVTNIQRETGVQQHGENSTNNESQRKRQRCSI